MKRAAQAVAAVGGAALAAAGFGFGRASAPVTPPAGYAMVPPGAMPVDRDITCRVHDKPDGGMVADCSVAPRLGP